jgi:hypothetical protein
MDEHYKSHSIHVVALFYAYSKKYFRPSAKVIWSEGGIQRFMPLIFDDDVDFPTREEAERYALEHAKKWIDEGKPESSRMIK